MGVVKILLLTDKLTTGGAENYFCTLENNLFHEEMTFYAAAATGELHKQVKYPKRFLLLHRKNHLQNLFKLTGWIKKKDIRLVHANSLRMVLYTIALRMLSWRKLKVVYTKHNVTVLERKYPSLFAKLLRLYVDKIITVSHFEKDNLTGLGIAARQIKTIYNGVDLRRFTMKEACVKKDPVQHIGMLARLSEEKNHDLFLEIAAGLRDVPHVLFHIAGDGPEKARIEDKIKQLNLQHKVVMLGNVTDPENFMRKIDVILITSHREVFPMTMLEAMAVGTPVISIDRGGIAEAVIHQETGLLIKNHSAAEFREQLDYLFTEDVARAEIIDQARQRVETVYSSAMMVSETVQTYEEIGTVSPENKGSFQVANDENGTTSLLKKDDLFTG